MDTTPQPSAPWTVAEKIFFRFVFIFFSLFIVIENNGAFPFWDVLMQYPTKLLQQAIPWIGKHVLHLSYDITVFTNGSGDTTYDYVIVLCILVLSVIGMVIWSVLDRTRTNYQKLYYWLTVAIRFYVGLMLISYGLYKVFKLQFPSPDLYRLTQLYGDSSPMGLAWTFLGFSKGYNLFMGIAEVAAVLLMFRRTMTLGAIITLMTTSNVMAVNYFYDVPVKILSTMLVVMTLFLLLHDAKRLYTFFFTGDPVSLPVIPVHNIRARWFVITRYVVKYLVIGFVLIYGGYQAFQAQKLYGDKAPDPPLYGLYSVDTFVVGHDTLAPLMTDTARWRQLIITWEGFARVRYMNDSTRGFFMKIDTTLAQMDLKLRADTTQHYIFHYQHPEENHFLLRGKSNTDSLSIAFTKHTDLKNFRLISRGFHWINEYPFNR